MCVELPKLALLKLDFSCEKSKIFWLSTILEIDLNFIILEVENSLSFSQLPHFSISTKFFLKSALSELLLDIMQLSFTVNFKH